MLPAPVCVGVAEAARRHEPRLTGNWSPFPECHVEPDWLLIWSRDKDTLVLVRTGTHSVPFG